MFSNFRPPPGLPHPAGLLDPPGLLDPLESVNINKPIEKSSRLRLGRKARIREELKEWRSNLNEASYNSIENKGIACLKEINNTFIDNKVMLQNILKFYIENNDQEGIESIQLFVKKINSDCLKFQDINRQSNYENKYCKKY